MKPDIKADDRGELFSLMEPLLIAENSRHRGQFTDLALELTQSPQACVAAFPLLFWLRSRTSSAR